uniref:Uncharacterized protein n=1 Tax=Lepeophtheirus salmonis TaxID=72036 RepID=A0A0K2V7J4_LEPSM
MIIIGERKKRWIDIYMSTHDVTFITSRRSNQLLGKEKES